MLEALVSCTLFSRAEAQGLLPHPFPASSSSPFPKVPGPSLLGSPCKRASIPPAAWVEQEAGSEEAAAVSQTAPTQAPARGPGGDRALALGLRFAEHAQHSQAWLRTALPRWGPPGSSCPVLLCSSPCSSLASVLSFHFLLFSFLLKFPLLCFFFPFFFSSCLSPSKPFLFRLLLLAV